MTCRAEYVTEWECPHASQKLGKTTSEQGHADNDIGLGDVSDMDIVERVEECCGRERERAAEAGQLPEKPAWK